MARRDVAGGAVIVVKRLAEEGQHPGVDAVGAVIADPVRKPRPRDARLEAICLGVGPHRHESAIATAHQPEPVVVALYLLLYCVYPSEDLAPVAASEIAAVHVHNSLAPALTSPPIGTDPPQPLSPQT